MGEAVRLCKVVEGVEFTVIEQDVSVRALILRETLESLYGAREEPESWITAYVDHADEIDCAAADWYRSGPGQHVVVLRPERMLRVPQAEPAALGVEAA